LIQSPNWQFWDFLLRGGFFVCFSLLQNAKSFHKLNTLLNMEYIAFSLQANPIGGYKVDHKPFGRGDALTPAALTT
jgi:hypothetical protein